MIFVTNVKHGEYMYINIKSLKRLNSKEPYLKHHPSIKKILGPERIEMIRKNKRKRRLKKGRTKVKKEGIYIFSVITVKRAE